MDFAEEGDNGEVINEEWETVERDCGDYVEVIPVRLVFKNDHLRVFVGNEIQDKDDGRDDDNAIRLSVPPMVFKCPKQMPPNMTLESLTDNVLEEGMGEYMAAYKEGLIKAWTKREEKRKKLESLTDKVLEEGMGEYMASYKEGLIKAWTEIEEKRKKKKKEEY